MRRRRTPFLDQIRIIVNENDDKLDDKGRAFLGDLAKNPDTEDVWTSIEKSCGPQAVLTMRFFIREVAGARCLVEDADRWPDQRAIRKKIEDFGLFLESLKGDVLFPVDGVDEAIASLRHVAGKLRKREQSSLVSRRRQDMGGSRKRIFFMQVMSMEMKDFFGRPLDDAVALLTNIFFPDAPVTTDSVRAARRPSQRQRRKPAA